MSINVTATAAPITVSASGTKVEATVSDSKIDAVFGGGIGPQGPPGPNPDVSLSGGVVSPLVLTIDQQVQA